MNLIDHRKLYHLTKALKKLKNITKKKEKRITNPSDSSPLENFFIRNKKNIKRILERIA
jgi:uncharacterized protein (DUF342 family)